MDSSNNFIFDSTRATGCEEYQGSLVHLDNLLLTDPNDWGLGKTVTVSQGSLTFPMQIGLDRALGSLNPSRWRAIRSASRRLWIRKAATIKAGTACG